MADTFDVHIVNLNLGSYSGATEWPLGYLPSGGGGITVISAALAAQTAGTSVGGQLVTMTNVATGGTPAINGTIGAFAGTIVTAAGVVHLATLSGKYVEDPAWIGFDQTSGTVPVTTQITIAYVMGR